MAVWDEIAQWCESLAERDQGAQLTHDVLIEIVDRDRLVTAADVYPEVCVD